MDTRTRAPQTQTLALAAVLSVVIVYMAYSVLLVVASWPIDELSISSAAIFGDSFGSINSIFGAATTLLIVWTIIIQQRELRLQQQEMSRMVSSQQGQLHRDILQIAMDSNELAEVWGDEWSGEQEAFRQHTYANMILSWWEDGYAEEMLDEDVVEGLLEHYMQTSSPLRAFWEKAESVSSERQRSTGRRREFNDMADRACRKFIASQTKSTDE